MPVPIFDSRGNGAGLARVSTGRFADAAHPTGPRAQLFTESRYQSVQVGRVLITTLLGRELCSWLAKGSV